MSVKAGDGEYVSKNTKVMARYRGGGEYETGKVTRVRPDGTVDVKYDNGEEVRQNDAPTPHQRRHHLGSPSCATRALG